MTIARVVIPGVPHHVVQRGVRAMRMFATNHDREAYLSLLRECGRRYGCAFWAWCLMDNHAHLVAVPEKENSLTRAIGESHRQYSRTVNKRDGQRGHLFQGRFYSYPIRHDAHLVAAVRYIELNPAAAGICPAPEDYRWSSARARLRGGMDRLVTPGPLEEMVRDWGAMLRERLGQVLTEAEVTRRLRAGKSVD